MSVRPATVYEAGYVIAGKYELEALLGQGGMGAVWRARNIGLDSLVAIKVLRATGDRAALRGRLVQEARAAAKLAHPAIVKVFDVGQTESGDPFIVMELLHGSSFGTILATETRVSPIEAVRILLPIADALSLSHAKGIIHRDIKPDNVFIVNDGGSVQPKLVDFGIVKVQQGDAESHLTQAGAVLGSPDYMSPEQARGEEDIDAATDIWSFAVVLYEAITGQTPFRGANYNALLRQIVEETPVPPDALAAADAALSGIVMRGLSKQRQDRFGSMGELGRALATWLVSQGVHEDICGIGLEARWMRGTDPHGRPMTRASLVSITDAWPSESGSGVRPNEVGQINTLPAPPRTTDHGVPPGQGESPVEVEAGAAVVERPAVSKWLIGVGVALVAGPLGFFVFQHLRGSETQNRTAGSAAPAVTAATSPTRISRAPTIAIPPVPAPAPSLERAPARQSDHATAQGAARKVSSRKGRAPAVGAPRPSSKSPGASPPGAKAPGDLISPYQ